MYKSVQHFGTFLAKYSTYLDYIYKGQKSTLNYKVYESSSKGGHIIFFDKQMLDSIQSFDTVIIDSSIPIEVNIHGVQKFLTLLVKVDAVVWFIN